MRIVNVNRHVIRFNRKTGERKPPFRVANGRYGKPWYVSEMELAPGVWLRYRPDDPLPCGATVYMEIEDEAARV